VGVAGLINRQPLVAGEIARAMLKMQCDGDDAGYNILLAGACLEDVSENGLGKPAANEIQTALHDAMMNRSLPPAIQRDAGFSLAGSGWVPKDLDEWVNIPAGEFLYGDDKKRMKIEGAFAIQKYPVTNSQFKRFMDDDGYDREELWSKDGWAWKTGKYDSKAPKEYKDWLSKRPVEKRYEPYFWRDTKWNNPLAPVVGVTWFEAEAYANWLGKGLGREVRLPTEYEWERAARGSNGREYAWGNEFEMNKANCTEFWARDNDMSDFDKWMKWREKNSEIPSTTLVGQFQDGNTPDGISDLSGNVWEWTASWYEKEQTNRTLRGGSWDFNLWSARCADRFRSVPVNFDYFVGFRLVSPGSDSSGFCSAEF
jgi:formylglycine-generating enzyme required for sulfatase activity